MAAPERIIRLDEADPSPRDPHGWLIREGLSFTEVERMLDWLESSGINEREVSMDDVGTFAVQWRLGKASSGKR